VREREKIEEREREEIARERKKERERERRETEPHENGSEVLSMKTSHTRSQALPPPYSRRRKFAEKVLFRPTSPTKKEPTVFV
jgi:hypothetical protein